MQNFSKFLCFIILTSAANAGFGSTINVACEWNAISNAVLYTAQEGDTVLIAPGSCVASNYLIINKNISFHIQGSGTNLTTLISGNLAYVIQVANDSANVFTISDLNCVGHANNQAGFFITSGGPGPFHFYNIQMTNVLYRGISIGGGDSFGLVDHCYMKSPGGNPQFIDFEGSGYTSWAEPNPLGTTNVACVEDCYFDTGGTGGNGFFDSYEGSQMVWRHNFCNGVDYAGVHGYDSSVTSARTWEVYDNIFTNMGGMWGMDLRGGTGVVFSNKFYGGVGVAMLHYYRACDDTGVYTLLTMPGKGQASHFDSNPTDGQTLQLGFTHYKFVSAYAANPNWNGINGFGGGNVVIGATLAETITNLYNCVNLGPGAGTTYAPTIIGHDLIAIGLTATDLILTNALDGNTDAYGYPANQAPGVLTSYPLTGTNFVNNQVLLPCYSWSNTLNGVVAGFVVKNSWGECQTKVEGVTKLNRDYFNDTIPTNYVPLVYPHPLQALEHGGGLTSTQPAPPNSLKVVPNS